MENIYRELYHETDGRIAKDIFENKEFYPDGPDGLRNDDSRR